MKIGGFQRASLNLRDRRSTAWSQKTWQTTLVWQAVFEIKAQGT
jgi:hypothetical protein